MKIYHLLFASLLIFASCQSDDFANSNATNTDTSVRGLDPGPQGPDWVADCSSNDFPVNPTQSACSYQDDLFEYLAECTFRDANNYCDSNTPFSNGSYTTTTDFVDLFDLGDGSAWHDYINQNPIPNFPVLCASMCDQSGAGIPVGNLLDECEGDPYLQTITAATRDALISTALNFFVEEGADLLDVSCGEGSYLMPIKIEWAVYNVCGGQCCIDKWDDCGDGTYGILDINGYTSNSLHNLYPRVTFMCCTKNR